MDQDPVEHFLRVSKRSFKQEFRKFEVYSFYNFTSLQYLDFSFIYRRSEENVVLSSKKITSQKNCLVEILSGVTGKHIL